MSITNPVKRVAESLAIDGQVPKDAQIIVINMTCVGAVGDRRFVELADNGTSAGIQHPASAGNRIFGITLAAGAIGEVVPVCVSGLCELELGATLTAPDDLSAATTGKGIAAVATHVVGAQLLEDGADTNLRKVRVHGGGLYTAA